jgi:hypothetical protein
MKHRNLGKISAIERLRRTPSQQPFFLSKEKVAVLKLRKLKGVKK